MKEPARGQFKTERMKEEDENLYGRERERERVSLCVCACVRVSEREGERERAVGDREMEASYRI